MAHAVIPPSVEQVACILCGSGEAEPVVSAPDRDPESKRKDSYTVVRCSSCGLHFQNPRPPAERLGEFYPEHYYAYRPILPKKERGIKKLGRKLTDFSARGVREAFFGYPVRWGAPERWALKILLWPLWLRMHLLAKDVKIIPYQGKGRFLDLGCGTGQLLAYQRQFGLKVTGVEQSKAAAEFARRQYGVEVRVGTLEEANFPAGSFDAIHLSHVFEHLPDPAAAVDEMRRVLDEDGLIILKVPNRAGFSARRFGPYWLGLDLPRHLYHFDPKTISELLKRHGARVERIRQDVGSWSFWRESWRAEARELRHWTGKDPRWLKPFCQAAEIISCLLGRGSVLVVYARK